MPYSHGRTEPRAASNRARRRKGHQEGLRRDVIGGVSAESPVHVPMDLGVVALEDLGERFWSGERRRDQVGVVRRQ
jgi:hypothetical protein